jgi:hypothetical protein
MFALALALIPLPVAASDAASPAAAAPATSAKTGKVSLKESAAKAAASTRLASARRAQDAGKDSPAFFKTKGGAVALAVMVLGVGYALYSVNHDRIHSPAKQ